MFDVVSGDYASASRHASPELTSAFREASLVAGDGAPSEQGVATPELRRFLDACTVVTVERRMDSWAVVRWQPLTEELSDMARAYATGERELEYIDALPYGPFRFLVLKRKGRWLAGGMLPSKPDNSNTGLIIVD